MFPEKVSVLEFVERIDQVNQSPDPAIKQEEGNEILKSKVQNICEGDVIDSEQQPDAGTSSGYNTHMMLCARGQGYGMRDEPTRSAKQVGNRRSKGHIDFVVRR